MGRMTAGICKDDYSPDSKLVCIHILLMAMNSAASHHDNNSRKALSVPLAKEVAPQCRVVQGIAEASDTETCSFTSLIDAVKAVQAHLDPARLVFQQL